MNGLVKALKMRIHFILMEFKAKESQLQSRMSSPILNRFSGSPYIEIVEWPQVKSFFLSF